MRPERAPMLVLSSFSGKEKEPGKRATTSYGRSKTWIDVELIDKPNGGKISTQDKPQFMMLKFQNVMIQMHRTCFNQYQVSSAVLLFLHLINCLKPNQHSLQNHKNE